MRYSFGKPASDEAMPPIEQSEQPVQVVESVDPTLAAVPTPVVDAAPAASSCEAPSPGDLVGPDGCKASNTLVLSGVTFEHNKSLLTPESATVLDSFAEQLKTAGDIRISVIGHTDSQGDGDLNRALSESRAESVKQYLIEHGVDGTHMTAVGMGASQPIADNNSEEGRQQNRRVELRVIAAALTGAAEPTVSETAPTEATAAAAAAAGVEAPDAGAQSEPAVEASAAEAPTEAATESSGFDAPAPEASAGEAPAEQSDAEPVAEPTTADSPSPEPAVPVEGAAQPEGSSGGLW